MMREFCGERQADSVVSSVGESSAGSVFTGEIFDDAVYFTFSILFGYIDS